MVLIVKVPQVGGRPSAYNYGATALYRYIATTDYPEDRTMILIGNGETVEVHRVKELDLLARLFNALFDLRVETTGRASFEGCTQEILTKKLYTNKNRQRRHMLLNF